MFSQEETTTRFRSVPPRFAALANGVSIHADDYDDTGSALHVTAPVLPPAFALCELGRRSGKDLMLAFHVGVEVENKIGDAISPRHNKDGFHTTGTCGSFGSAAACAKLRGLNATQTACALGIAASEASGIRDNFGSMTKPFHAGHAAENGTVAADLALLGWTAADDILEAPLEEVADKFRTNAEFAKWPAQKAESIIALVKSLENQSDVGRLTAALTG